MDQLDIRHVASKEDFARAFKVREDVFVEEQGVSLAIEFDGLDDRCQHLLAVVGDRAAGTLRIRRVDEHAAKIERVAVGKTDRGRQVGAALMNAALKLLGESGVRSANIHAQTQALGFYQRLGFAAHGDIFDEDGIPHIAMSIDLER